MIPKQSLLTLTIGVFFLGGLAQCQPGESGADGKPGGESPDSVSMEEHMSPASDPETGWSRSPRGGSAVWGSARDDLWIGGQSGFLAHFDGRT